MFILLLRRKKCFKKFRPSWDIALRRGISGFRLSEGKLEIFTQRRCGQPQKTGIFDHTPVKA